MRLSRSTQFDWQLTPYDIRGSIAHAHALKKANILTDEECAQIEQGLTAMLADYQAGTLHPLESDEDVHGALERILIERIGAEVGGKLRAGRSRNDQIATLIRMYMLERADILQQNVVDLCNALAGQADQALGDAPNHHCETTLGTISSRHCETSDDTTPPRHCEEHEVRRGNPLQQQSLDCHDLKVSGRRGHTTPVIMPGRTHLQHAQPVLLSHHLLAHGWALLRDLDRLKDWRERAKKSPYGSGALAGQTLGLDANLIANELGFTAIESNSIDAVASRDITAEFLFIMTLIALNVSRIAEEIILWNTKEFDFVRLDDGYSTGSSIMPQKKNPDISELARGKSGRILGDLTGLLATLKAQPLAYNRDLQEDKEPIFDAVEQLEVLLPAFTGQIATAHFNYERMNYLAPRGFALATDIAEWLVKQGIPFRIAHELSGECVQLCETRSASPRHCETSDDTTPSRHCETSDDTTPSRHCEEPAGRRGNPLQSQSMDCHVANAPLGDDVELWNLTDADFERILGPALAQHANNTAPADVRTVLSATGSVTARNGANGTAPVSVRAQLTDFISLLGSLSS